jgi:uncharacterized membrane protein
MFTGMRRLLFLIYSQNIKILYLKEFAFTVLCVLITEQVKAIKAIKYFIFVMTGDNDIDINAKLKNII